MNRQNGLVKLRERKTKDGGASLYLEVMDGGVRRYEFLRLYIVPERTRLDKIRNSETRRTAFQTTVSGVKRYSFGISKKRQKRGAVLTALITSCCTTYGNTAPNCQYRRLVESFYRDL